MKIRVLLQEPPSPSRHAKSPSRTPYVRSDSTECVALIPLDPDASTRARKLGSTLGIAEGVSKASTILGVILGECLEEESRIPAIQNSKKKSKFLLEFLEEVGPLLITKATI